MGIMQFGNQIKGVLGALAIYKTIDLISASFVGVVKAAIDFESSFAGIRKTVNDLDEQGFQKLSDSIRSMALSMPIAVDELNRIGEAAGQLGVAGEDIAEFTRVAAMLGTTTNLSAEKAAEAIAILANIMGTEQAQLSNLADAIVHLGNESAATEEQIVDFAVRIAGAGKTIGLTESEILGFGTAMANVGIQAEMGGTAISRIFVELQKAVATGSEKLKDFAFVANMSVEQFTKAFRDTPAKAITAFIEGLSKVNERGKDTIVMLDKMGLDGVRVASTLQLLSNATKSVSSVLETARVGFESSNAAAVEFGKRLQTAESQITLAKNALNDLAIDLGSNLKVALSGFAQDFSSFVRGNQRELVDLLSAMASVGKGFMDLGRQMKEGLGQNTKDLIKTLTDLANILAFLGRMAIPPVFKWMAAASDQIGKVARSWQNLKEGVEILFSYKRALDEFNWSPASLPGIAADPNAPKFQGRKFTDEDLYGPGNLEGIRKWMDAKQQLLNLNKELGKEEQKLLEAFQKQLRPMDALEKEYVELHKLGVTYEQFLKVYGAEIIKAGEAQKGFGEAITASGEAMRQAALEASHWQVDTKTATKEITISVAELNETYEKFKDSFGDFKIKVEELNKSWEPEKVDLVKGVYEALAEQFDKATVAAKKLEDQLQKLADFQDFFSTLADALGGFAGDIFGSISEGFNAFGATLERFSATKKDLLGNELTKEGINVRSWAAGIGAAFSSLAQNMEGTTGRILGAIGSIAQGFAMGGWVGAAIAAIGELTNALFDLFSHDWEKDARDATQAVYDFVGALQLSSEFMDRLAKAGEERGDVLTQFHLMIKDVIDDLGGLTTVNAAEIFEMIPNLIELFKMGKVTAKEFTKALGDAFQDLADFAMKYGGVYLQQLKFMIAETERMGVVVPQIVEFMSKALDDFISNVNTFAEDFQSLIDTMLSRSEERIRAAAERIGGSFKEMVENMTDAQWADAIVNSLTDAELDRITQQWEKLAMFITDAFAEALEQGRNVIEIIGELGPSIQILLDAAEKFGLGTTGAFKDLLDLLKMFQGVAKQLERIDLMGNILKQLDLFGRLGPKYVNDWFGMIKKTLAEMMGYVDKNWKTQMADLLAQPFKTWTDQQRAAFQAMIPQLLQLAEYYKQLGIPLPPMLRDLLAIAKAQGYITDGAPTADPYEGIRLALIDIKDVLEDIRRALTGATEDAIVFGGRLAQAGRDAQAAWDWEFPKPPSDKDIGGHDKNGDGGGDKNINGGGGGGDQLITNGGNGNLTVSSGNGNRTLIIQLNGGDEQVLQDKMKRWFRDGTI